MKKLTTTFLLLAGSLGLIPQQMLSQQISLSNQYVVNKFSISPAYAGAGDNLEVFGSYRRDWMGVTAAPETKSIYANGIIGKHMGLGGNVTSMQAGIFTNLSANLNYAYHVHINGNHFISLGLGLGVIENHLDLSSKGAQDDPVANAANRTTTMMDASFGIVYRNRKLDVGFSAPRLLSNAAVDKHMYFLSSQYQGHIGLKQNLNKSWTIAPIAIVSMPQNAPLFYEIAVPVMYQNKIWIAPSYKKSSIAVSIGARLLTSLVFNYSYEFASSGIASQSSGTHEITLGWRFAKKKTDEPTPDSKKPYYEWVK
ncbi:MAG: PorP/SprF family type IX secretion system membrane protein [Bacteroidota bacterium]